METLKATISEEILLYTVFSYYVKFTFPSSKQPAYVILKNIKYYIIYILSHILLVVAGSYQILIFLKNVLL